MVILFILLYPFAVLYDLITRFRNRLYDLGFKPATSFDLAVIGVGNLTVGGTGKSPLIEYLIRRLSGMYKVATLSRGYGRKTKGFRICGPLDDAGTVGDEPYQFYAKYGEKVKVAVGEDRAYAIPNILQEHPETEVILLDDAYQHRSVRPSLNILLSDYNRPFYKDFLLPSGRLRESRKGAGRANVVIVTKCPPDIGNYDMMNIEKSIHQYTSTPVFFTAVKYGQPTGFGNIDYKIGKEVILVSGISDPAPLERYVSKHFKVVKHMAFADHHHYANSDLERLKKDYPGISILTTEKDKVKLAASVFAEVTKSLPLFYLPIEVQFVKNGEEFDEMILNTIRRAG